MSGKFHFPNKSEKIINLEEHSMDGGGGNIQMVPGMAEEGKIRIGLPRTMIISSNPTGATYDKRRIRWKDE